MQMSHFMQLLGANHPWNLIIFMAIPMLMIETIAITEFYLIFNRKTSGTVKLINKFCSIFFGFYFTGISIYLMFNAVIPVTLTGGWLGWVDAATVIINVTGMLFMLPLALLELGLIYKKKSADQKLKVHFILVSGFLIIGHVAMVLGMVDPGVMNPMPMNDNMNMKMDMEM